MSSLEIPHSQLRLKRRGSPLTLLGWMVFRAQFYSDMSFSTRSSLLCVNLYILQASKGASESQTESGGGGERTHLYRRMLTHEWRAVAPIVIVDVDRLFTWFQRNTPHVINYQVKEIPSWWRKLAGVILTEWST